MPKRRLSVCCLVAALLAAAAVQAQTLPVASSLPPAGANWARVKALPPGTAVHVSTDHGGRTCRVLQVSDDALTCARGKVAGAVLPEGDIRQVKLTHRIRSAAVGFGVAGGLGAAIGGVAGRTKPCAPNTFCLNGLGGGGSLVALVVGVPSAVVGGVVGGTTDFARGSSIYKQP